MRYHYEKPKLYSSSYGEIYRCNHPVYDYCTLYKIGNKGLAVIQQRFHPESKSTSWGPIDDWLVDELYLNKYFEEYFRFKAGTAKNGLYPTVSIRQAMWALKMKPLQRAPWETAFDKSPF